MRLMEILRFCDRSSNRNTSASFPRPSLLGIIPPYRAHLAAADLSRVANAALRSTTTIFRQTSTIQSRSLALLSYPRTRPTPPTLARYPLPTTSAAARSYADWTIPNRATRGNKKEDLSDLDDGIVKSDSSFEIIYGSTKDSEYASDYSSKDPFQLKGIFTPSEPADKGPGVQPPPMRLVPRLGRTHYVSRNADVASVFKFLHHDVQRNQVKQDHRKQKFHERPGMKRKRLRSERWRKRFGHGFKAAVDRVNELKKQGW
ncbi:hypothetical protein GGS20DRAFT_598283 [Poronia punctata]|nr:hypothetical protein GGS20DRAFT_598283 [Poronia punctata]